MRFSMAFDHRGMRRQRSCSRANHHRALHPLIQRGEFVEFAGEASDSARRDFALDRLFIAPPYAEGACSPIVAIRVRLTNCYDVNASSSAFASLRSSVSNPSVNQP